MLLSDAEKDRAGEIEDLYGLLRKAEEGDGKPFYRPKPRLFVGIHKHCCY